MNKRMIKMILYKYYTILILLLCVSVGNSRSKTIIIPGILHMDLPPAGRRGAVQLDRGQGAGLLTLPG